MSKRKHTKGPWRVSHSNWFNILTESRPASVPTLVASVSLTAAKNVGLTDAERAEFQANAHLIAAAPDLLAACEKLYAALREYTDEGETAAQSAVLEMAEAAIARAEGKAPPTPNRE